MVKGISFDSIIKNRLKNHPKQNRQFQNGLLMAKFGALVTYYRYQNHLTQKQLAQRAGIDQSQVARIENGSNTSLATVNSLYQIMNHQIEIKIRPKKSNQVKV